jgi:DNA-directed RNA polymerase beta subunit
MENIQKHINKLIELYFGQLNGNILYEHLFASYDKFVSDIIPYSLIQENNIFYENVEKEFIYHHGFKFSNIKIKPSTFDNDNQLKFPCDARRNHLNYFASIIADIQQVVEIIDSINGNITIKNIGELEKETPIANIPIMLKSRYCSTNIKQDIRGECKFDPGGYFIVNGQEKIILSMEKMVDNKILVFSKKDPSYEDGFIYVAQINSKKNDWSDNLQILTIKTRKNGVFTVSTSSQLVDISFFVLMRALGIESDKDIISYITYNLEDTKMLNLLRNSIVNSVDDNNNNIYTKEEAVEFLLTKLKRNKRISNDETIAKYQKKMYLQKIFRQDLLPHLGEDIPKKIMFLGLMMNKLINVILGRQPPDDRDALHNKRIEPPGVLLGQLFRQNWKKMLNEIGKHFKKKNQYDLNPINVIGQIKPSTIEHGLKTALATGVWGMNKTKKGVAQPLQRLSWPQGNSYLRRILSPSMDESTAKVTSIRHINNNQIQLLCITGDTNIILNNGIKQIKDITEDDIVITVNPKTLKEESSKIYNLFKKESNELLKIIIINDYIIKATNEHPFLINNNGIPTWINADNLKINDKVYIKNNINYNNSKNVILTRLLFFQKSFENFKYNNNDIIEYIVDNEQDALSIADDIKSIGFEYPIITYNNNNILISSDDINLKNFYMVLLTNNNIISDWILNSTNIIKQEFISYLDYNIIINQLKIIINNEISITELEQILIFDIHFNIELENNKIVLLFNNYIDIIKYLKLLCIKYNQELQFYIFTLIEYYTLLNNNINITYEEFKNDYINNNTICMPIKNINKIKPEIVYDFTTYSNNHSFIANNIVVSNCPVETPEGSKIGIVKSLAMMSSITTQNASQYDVIKNILKHKNIKHPYDINPLEMNKYVKIFINGDWYGVCLITDANDIYNDLKLKRRETKIDKFTSILMDYKYREIRMYYDGGRLYRPLLIINNNKLNINEELIKFIDEEMKLKDKNKSWIKMLDKFNNLIEYEDIESLNYTLVADSPEKLDIAIESKNKKPDTNESSINRYGDFRWVKYTHCDFHAWTMLGNIVCNVPFSNHNYATRNIIHFSQAKQAIGIYLTSYKDRMDISQILYYPHIPIVTTQGMKYNRFLDLPYGENAIVAVCSYNGYNQEDSIIFNKSSIDRGIFRADTLKKYDVEIFKNPSTSQDDVFTKPDRNKVTGMKQGNYDKLNEKGYIPEETEILDEDIIIGKISPIQPTGNNNKVYKDNSTIFKSNVPGVIDRIHTGIYNSEGYEMYNMRVRMERILIPGDKMTDRHGQKGTIGITYQQKDMPFTERGIIPDLILNPCGYPSRMCLGQIIECLASKEAAETCHLVDGTPFCNYDVKQLPELMKKIGYSPYGTEVMYCGLTGRKMDAEIYIGPIFIIRLKHLVLDKVHGRARGPKQALTRQPLEGRSRDGGLKIGEMEKDAMVAHGIGQFIKERLMETSDITKVHVCNDCGMFASKVIDKDYYRCKGCHNTTRISAVVIPYACKLLFQELTAINILPRIRTEKNIYCDEI